MMKRWNVAVVALAGLITFVCLYAGDALGQRLGQGKTREVLKAQDEKDKAKDKEQPKVADKSNLRQAYYGVVACAGGSCHSGTPPEQWVLNPDTNKPYDPLCRCDEKSRWEKTDKHAEAWKVLTGERGKRMAQILGYDVTKAKACLVCHAVYLDPEKDKDLLRTSVGLRFSPEEGVNCVVCHGAYTNWVSKHGQFVEAGDFRPLSREKKETEFGMRNLWDPVKRTELCSSCHVGNWQESKFVTHDMYAAGHPPLPGFEVTAFSDEMPRHWEYLRDKKPSIQKELGLREGEFEQTQLLLVGAAISLRDTMRLLIAQAELAQNSKEEKYRVLDLSNFDCYACHHNLKRDSWRQERGYRGRPGRVPMRSWSTELVKLAISHLAAAENGVDDKKLVGDLEKGMENLSKAFESSTVGDPKKIQEAAKEVEDWSNKLAARLNKAFVTKKTADSLLLKIPEQFTQILLDYDSARQVGWASEVLFKEAYNLKGEGDKKVLESLAAIDKKLRLRLPQGRGEGKWIEDQLQNNLDAVNNYDPRGFRELLKEFGKTLKK